MNNQIEIEMCMVLDVVTGKPKRFGDKNNAIGTLDEALEYINSYATQDMIVKLNYIMKR